MSTTYIISQIFITIGLGLQASTYFIRRRNVQLAAVIGSNFCTAICFILLGAHVAAAMNFVAIGRDVTRRIMGEHSCGWRTMYFWIAVMTIMAILTEHGIMSIFPYVSMLIFTVAIWQSNIFVYRVAGLATNTLLIIYNAHIGNTMGVILQSGLLICAILGLISCINEHRAIHKL